MKGKQNNIKLNFICVFFYGLSIKLYCYCKLLYIEGSTSTNTSENGLLGVWSGIREYILIFYSNMFVLISHFSLK